MVECSMPSACPPVHPYIWQFADWLICWNNYSYFLPLLSSFVNLWVSCTRNSSQTLHCRHHHLLRVTVSQSLSHQPARQSGDS